MKAGVRGEGEEVVSWQCSDVGLGQIACEVPKQVCECVLYTYVNVYIYIHICIYIHT